MCNFFFPARKASERLGTLEFKLERWNWNAGIGTLELEGLGTLEFPPPSYEMERKGKKTLAEPAPAAGGPERFPGVREGGRRVPASAARRTHDAQR